MMNRSTYLALFTCLLAFLSFQMTCNDVLAPGTGTEVVDTVCIDKTKIDPGKGCPRDYTPVCGCDGKTYSNVCTAEKNGVTSWTEGECPCVVESRRRPDMPCTKEFKPVCGCDNKTYANECLAQNAGLTKWTKGACEDTGAVDCIDPSKISRKPCPDVYQPVCGCDRKTYGNDCEAQNQGLTSWTPGKCKDTEKCIDPSKINPTAICTREYQPVCGCDGKTYGNACEAEKAGVTRTRPGKCNQ